MSHRFLQIHTLISYPASLLNRDDVGFAKRVPFGGAARVRVSSQCLKRHLRRFEGEHALSAIQVEGGTAPMSIRSRLTFERHVLEPLVASGVDDAIARSVVEGLMVEVLGESAKAKKSKAEKASKGEAQESLQTGQVTVLGRPEVDFLLNEARAICAETKSADKARDAVKARMTKERKENLRALRCGAGLDAALFGRMVTSDNLARTDAAIHVAHSFTTHEQLAETDYFSAVDDLMTSGDEGQLGSGHIGTTELTSGLFYGYVVVDLPLLVSNLSGVKQAEWEKGDRKLAGEVVERLLWLLATVSPGAKLGSTAPYAYAHMVMVEAGKAQPRTLANAFLSPVKTRPDVMENSYAALASHLGDLDAMYGATTERRVAGIGPKEILSKVAGEAVSLGDVAGFAASVARGT